MGISVLMKPQAVGIRTRKSNPISQKPVGCPYFHIAILVTAAPDIYILLIRTYYFSWVNSSMKMVLITCPFAYPSVMDITFENGER